MSSVQRSSNCYRIYAGDKDAYLVQLEQEMDDLVKYAIPSINDQSTNARIRGGQVMHIDDLDPWS